MKEENIYIDLSKCSEQERKLIPHILKKLGKKTTPAFNGNICNSDIVHFHNEWRQWALSVRIPKGKTELTYTEFIKLFEGGEGEKNTYSFSYLSCGKTLTVHIEAKNLNKAMIEFATNYHDIEWLYHAKIL